ncbi:segregation/condensation protein A [Sorangium sp. So ce1036]|uniref:segregation and condensation protein A n=1 Tax=Sorangium sp. So ce1036 TaxID=3133328 RepID=UPI003F0E892C
MSGSKAGAARARGGKGRGGAGAAPRPAAPAAREAAATPAPGVAEEAGPREGEYVVQLPTFEGPLDLLLHLIQQHELDILDIPVSFVTEKYLEYLRIMRSLSIDLASEYLVMAATLAHIKSKMLLPSVPAGQDDDGMPGEEEDPRAELVRRLLEYQKYKVAAAELGERGTLGRDVFTRGMSEAEVPKGPAPFAPTSIFGLLDAFERVLKRTNVQIDHEVVFDRISITDRIVELTEKLSARRAMRFEDLLLDSVSKGGVIPRFEVVITFLAVLEMCKLKLIRVHQTDPLAPIHIELAVADGAAPAAPELQDGAGAAEAQPVEATPGEARGAPPAGEPLEAEVGDGGPAGAEAAEVGPVEAELIETELAGAEPVEADPVEEEPVEAGLAGAELAGAESVEIESVDLAEVVSAAPAETGDEAATEEPAESAVLEQESVARGESAAEGEVATETEAGTALEGASRDVATRMSDVTLEAAATPSAGVDEVDAGSGRDGG